MSTYLGIDIGGTNIKAAVVREDGRVAAFEASGWSGGSPADALATIVRLADAVIAAAGCTPSGCGVGCAGLIDAASGIVLRSPNLPQWHDVRLTGMLGAALSMPVVVENDASAAAYGEFAAGAARGAENVVMVTIGTGIGGGIILGGRVYRGSHGFAGEIGHSIVDLSGNVQCACGATGCVEPLVNAESLVLRARQRLQAGERSVLSSFADGELTARVVGEAAKSGDRLASAVAADAGRALGVLLTNIVAYLDPDIIVIGGGVAAAGSSLMNAARAEYAARTAMYQGASTRLVMAELADTAGVVGAALLAHSELAR
ncbi:ROK family protein [bacterium]|nr:ROK family protein [bacterium]